MNQECLNCIQRMYFLSIGTTNETTTETTTTTMEPSKLSLTNMNRQKMFLLCLSNILNHFSVIYGK